MTALSVVNPRWPLNDPIVMTNPQLIVLRNRAAIGISVAPSAALAKARHRCVARLS